MSRLRIFVLLATVVALAGALTACGSSDSSDEDPQTILENATTDGLKSGTIELSLGIKSTGKKGGLNVSISGPFQGALESGSLPRFDLDLTAKGEVNDEPVDIQAGITVLSNRAFIDYKGTVYEVDPTTFGFVKSTFEQAQAQGGSEVSAAPTACQEALSTIDLNTVVDNLSNEGSADVEGTSTTKISGELNPDGVVDAVEALRDDPACGAQLEATGALEEFEATQDDFTSALKKAPVEIYVGDDDIIRKIDAAITVEPKNADGEKVEVDLSFTLGAVNEEQTIAAPATAEPLEGLFKELGINPLELLEAGEGGGLGGLLEGLGDSGKGPLGDLDLGDIPGTEFSQEYLECLEKAKTASDLQDCTSLLG